MTERLVFLVPGFFGFTSVGAMSYFEDVEQEARSRAPTARCRGAHRAVRDAADGLDPAARRRAAPPGAPQRRPCRPGAALRRALDGRPRRAHAVDAGSEDRIRRLGRAHCPPDEDGHLREHAAPRHAARQSLHHRPRPDTAAGAHRPRDVRTGTRRDSRCGEGSRARREARRLRGAQGRSARSPCRGSVAEDPVRPPRPRVAISRRDRARPGRRSAAHARGHRALRCGRGGSRRDRLWLRRHRRAGAARDVRDEGAPGSRIHCLAFAVQTAARSDGTAAPALPVPETGQGDTAAARSRARLQGNFAHQRRHRADAEPVARPGRCTSRGPTTSMWSGITRWRAARQGTGCPRAPASRPKHSTPPGRRWRRRSRKSARRRPEPAAKGPLSQRPVRRVEPGCDEPRPSRSARRTHDRGSGLPHSIRHNGECPRTTRWVAEPPRPRPAMRRHRRDASRGGSAWERCATSRRS